MRAHPCDAFERCIEGPKCRTAIVTSQDAHVVGHFWKKLSQTSHRAFIHLDMQVANVQQRKAIEPTWQRLHANIIVSDLNLIGVPAATPIQSHQLERRPYDGM